MCPRPEQSDEKFPVPKHGAGDASAHIEVCFLGALVAADCHREYQFDLLVRGEKVSHISGRYSRLRSRCLPVFGEFPSRHVFENFKANEKNVARRGKEIQAFFEKHLNDPKAGKLDTMFRPEQQSQPAARRGRSKSPCIAKEVRRPSKESRAATRERSSSPTFDEIAVKAVDRARESSPLARMAVDVATATANEANALIKNFSSLSSNKEATPLMRNFMSAGCVC